MRTLVDSLFQDIRYAVRGFRRTPLFAAGVAGTIGLGLGFVCSAFTVVNGYLLKPVLLPDPYALYELTWDTPAQRYHRLTVDDFDSVRAGNEVFSDVVGFAGVQIVQDEAPVHGQLVTGNYFQALGMQTELGRTLLPEDAARPGERAVAVLSHEAWLTRYGANPSIVGQEIRLGRGTYLVVGVARRGFSGFSDAPISFWVPLTMARAFPMPDPYASPPANILTTIARLRPAVTPAAAQASFDLWLKRRFATADADHASIVTRVESRATMIPITPKTTAIFSAVIAAFAFVLLVACANVANMMLARGMTRQREIAVRLSLGARRTRIVRQLLIESVLLALPAALVGLGVTIATARAVPALILETWPEGLPPVQALVAPMDPDIRVVVFLMMATIAAAVLFGLSPAVQMSRTSLSRASRGELGDSVRISRVRNALVVAQIAACALFLITAVGLLDELGTMARAETGLAIDQVADLRVQGEYRVAVAERLAANPAIELVAGAARPPLAGPLRTVQVRPEGGSQQFTAGFAIVSREYFDVFRIPLLRGRTFSREEGEAAADVVVVSEATARRFWPAADAIGQTLEVLPSAGRPTGEQRPSQTRARVIGIAKDVASGSVLDGIDWTCVYFPVSVARAEARSILVRSRTDITSLRAAVQAATSVVREDAGYQLFPIRQALGLQIWALQVVSAIASLLAVVGLLLAFSGTYGVVAFLVTQRTREFGIRMALGATVSDIISAVVANAMRLGVGGIAIGGLLALAVSQVLSPILAFMPGFSPLPYIIGAAVVLAAATVAASVPSVRAARVDPATALRTE